MTTNITKIGEMEGLLNSERIMADIETFEAESKWGEVRPLRRLLKTIEKRRLPKRRHLVEFIRLVQRYQRVGEVRLDLAGVDEVVPESIITRETTASKGRQSDRKLIRKPDTTQTKIANVILVGFKTGEVFELEMAVDRLRHIVPASMVPNRWVGTYLARETAYQNGILELVAPKRYKLRSGARKLVENTV